MLILLYIIPCISLFFQIFIYGLDYEPSWKMFHMYIFKTMYIILFWVQFSTDLIRINWLTVQIYVFTGFLCSLFCRSLRTTEMNNTKCITFHWLFERAHLKSHQSKYFILLTKKPSRTFQYQSIKQKRQSSSHVCW